MILSPVLRDLRVEKLLGCIGIPYWWAKGTPASPFPLDGYDCSGFVQGALVYLRMLKSSEPDRSAHDLAMVCDPVVAGDAQLGDLEFYGYPRITHVMLCLGHGWVLGAAGGTSTTHGDDPRAYVKLQRSGYRRVNVVGRTKREVRP